MYNKVLILSPHTDDGELGCGGFITKLKDIGSEIYYIAFSSAEKSVPKEYPKDILKMEVKKATSILGIKEENLFILNYEVRTFHEKRQNILEDLIKFKKNIKPDLVLLPSLHDIHQDHITIAKEGLRAFKNTTILGYELPWNNLTIDTTCFVKLQEYNIKMKAKALRAYESQKNRVYFTEGFIFNLARTRGVQIGCDYAEVFEVIRLVID
ncbi:PIG-L family deacetylase [Clostridium sp. D2Q-11]|uniref:PIG-L family deacetylase n=1 Tax=Anaeromonas frigoriresistens TaxID=2683708 RepID=A0A942UTA2_9FIRM|nr:PIG-L family deacetylase [Anaeromonas frigoriresistens]MBS4538829.1 PIG-L family deacetylase [Anaeromonas frigoriresistens]